MTPIQQLYLGVGAKDKTYLDDVFSTYVYKGTAGSNSVNNGINLSDEGGLLWFKERSGGAAHQIFDTVRGATKQLRSDGSQAEETRSYGLTFNTNGYSLNTSDGNINSSSNTYASWSFRKAPGFFDIVTYTGNGSNRTIAHSLGSVPGCIMVKKTSNSDSWCVYHSGVDASSPEDYALNLNNTAARDDNSVYWNDTAPTSTVFSVGTANGTNQNGETYVAYLFAHEEAEFGANSDKKIISCGTFTSDSSENAEVNLGWEPQFILWKSTNQAWNWYIHDTMRGWDYGWNMDGLYPNATNAENNQGGTNSAVLPTATGFKSVGSWLGANNTFIYIAIRRPDGYVGKPPELGTDVFAMDTGNSSSTIPCFDSGFPVDFAMFREIAATCDWFTGGRLVGTKYLLTNTTAAEANLNSQVWDSNTGFQKGQPSGYQAFMWRRSAGFDVVTYDGTSTAGHQVPHNLSKTPEMIWVKARTGTSAQHQNWRVYHKGLNGGTTPEKYFLNLDNTVAENDNTGNWNDTAPTSTHVTLGNSAETNSSGYTYLMMLFASVDGISKVGYYTGSGGSQTITTGFQPRFLIIKSTSASGAWYTLDTTRGWGSGNDEYLEMNNDNAQDSLDFGAPTSTGFTISSVQNGNGTKYIYYAHA